MKSAEIENLHTAWPWRAIHTAGSAAPLVVSAWEYGSGEREIWHAHQEAQMIYVTRGVLRVSTPAGIWTLPPFHGIWLPPTVLHELQAVGAVAVRSALIAPEASLAVQEWKQCRVLRVGPLLDALVGTLTGPIDEADPRSELVVSLFLLELSKAQTALTSGALPLPHDRRLRMICEQLLADPQNNDTIELWSERVGASVRTLARLFREETGLSFGQWRQQLRLVEAMTRLALGIPVSTIAVELGYQSSSAFISMFRKVLGDTPQRYLRRFEDTRDALAT
ncbi:AraC family transcriptional regulator [Pararobbsia silviterrae]|uniref:AraC family transcriptional regulator n=1 Tax=Pararobbsia silviterrae TaxID=1792498 RepID=A0A494Y1B4_9BURK|nr:helix-turn-helix transcriptional regulator [Pararobbsia silviterrae]RKP53645.1 AraC family transcriptional regulator [Pararobbsia silviterrae]